jgi:penicillin-binding protein 2
MKTPETSHSNYEPWRMLVLYGLIAVIFGFYTLRLFDLQVVSGHEYLAQAEENRISTISLPTQRGIIYDRNGVVLARNTASYNVVITPANLPIGDTINMDEPNGAIQKIYRELSALIDVPVSNGEINDETVRLFKPCDTDLGILQVVYIGDTNAPYDPVRIKCSVDVSLAMIVQERAADWPGVGIEVEAVRDYPTGELTSEIVGFLGPIPALEEEYYRGQGFVPNRDKVGYAGVEASLQDILQGRNGQKTIEVDVAGKELRTIGEVVPATPGQNVRLTIDARLQLAAKTALKDEIKFWNGFLNETLSTNGVAIAMNPRTGEVLALVSYPTFENNRMAQAIPGDYYEQLQQDPDRPLFNHAISAEHPPGSVFKMAAAVGILNEDVVTVNQIVEDPGKITIIQKYSENDPGTPRDYVCWVYKDGGKHGDVNYYKGIYESCDVYWYKVGGGYPGEVEEGLGIWRMGDYARALGYGVRTGIELPGEARGLMPDPTWKRLTVGENWSTGDTYIATMGQGFVLSTPLQVLQSFATLANDGKRMQPTLVHDVLDSEGNVVKPFQPRLQVDITQTPVINVYDERSRTTGEMKVVEPWVIDEAKIGMREVVTLGTSKAQFEGMTIQSAGKTGTAEYCNKIADDQGLCVPGRWPAHAWYAGYAPYDNPEIAVMAFVYNGKEGSTVAAPVVRRIMEAYFELKAVDAAKTPTGQ